MRALTATVLVRLAALAGCAEDEASYELRGTFTEDASEEQMDELEAEITDRGGEMFRLESFPVQFHATGLGPDTCEEVRSFAQEADYVQDVDGCQLETGLEDGDEPTGNGS